MLRGAFHHNGETSERKRLIAGIFNSCHSRCLHLSVPCLLAQLTAHNMVQCCARPHYANAERVRFDRAVSLREERAEPAPLAADTAEEGTRQGEFCGAARARESQRASECMRARARAA